MYEQICLTAEWTQDKENNNTVLEWERVSTKEYLLTLPVYVWVLKVMPDDE